MSETEGRTQELVNWRAMALLLLPLPVGRQGGGRRILSGYCKTNEKRRTPVFDETPAHTALSLPHLTPPQAGGGTKHTQPRAPPSCRCLEFALAPRPSWGEAGINKAPLRSSAAPCLAPRPLWERGWGEGDFRHLTEPSNQPNSRRRRTPLQTAIGIRPSIL